MIVFAVALLALTTAHAQASPEIVFKITNAFDLIWTDAGSGANTDGAVWRAQNYQSNYCSLGDVATEGYSKPTANAVLVSQPGNSGALIHPTSFSLVWNDRGSGANDDVAIYSMNAPSGYTCLGGVAVRSHTDQPKRNNYCCVKNQYTVQANTMPIWDDRGSGADSDISLWEVVRAGGEAYGVFGGNFIGVSGYSKPFTAHLLKEDNNKVMDVWKIPTKQNKPLSLYEMNQLTNIWNDAGSGADVDFSIWRAQKTSGFYPVGDIAVATHSKPSIGFLIQPKDADDIKYPVSYSRIWNDAGSGAHRDVVLWRVNCPSGYVSLGNIATPGNYPGMKDVVCVKRSYTSYGGYNNWQYVWRDHGSGAHTDLSVYEAVGKSWDQQSVRGFGAATNYNYYPSPPYLLSKQHHTYRAEKPISEIIIESVDYHTPSEKYETAPVKINPTDIINNSNLQQEVERKLFYSYTKSHYFEFSQTIHVGMTMKFRNGAFMGPRTTTTATASSTTTFKNGSRTSETIQDSITMNVKVEPRTKMTAIIVGKQYKADIPFTATITKMYYDGTNARTTISGKYEGVDVRQVSVEYGRGEKI